MYIYILISHNLCYEANNAFILGFMHVKIIIVIIISPHLLDEDFFIKNIFWPENDF